MNPEDTILILDDDPNDVFFLKRAFKKNGINNPIQVLPDGEEGTHYMAGHGLYADRVKFPFPKLIILDLKMPRKTGLEFLEWISERPALRVIPTILLSSSGLPCDVERAYHLGANTYFVKPNHFDDFCELVASLERYWKQAARPPIPSAN